MKTVDALIKSMDESPAEWSLNEKHCTREGPVTSSHPNPATVHIQLKNGSTELLMSRPFVVRFSRRDKRRVTKAINRLKSLKTSDLLGVKDG